MTIDISKFLSDDTAEMPRVYTHQRQGHTQRNNC